MNKVTDNLGKFILSRLRSPEMRAENLKIIQQMTKDSYLGNYISVCRILGRFDCFVDTRDDSHSLHLIRKGFWEIQNTECVARIVQKGMNVIDIGSNLGYFTLLMCGLVGNSAGKVYSIEANPLVYKLLIRSLSLSGQLSKTKPINCAIYQEKTNDLPFSFGDASSLNGRLSCLLSNPHRLREGEILTKVNGDTLDNLIPIGEKIDFIKVDIEGAEEMFWYGSRRVRKENKNLSILMEFNARKYNNTAALIDDILDSGYQIKVLGKKQSFDRLVSKNQLLNEATNQHTMILLERV